MSDAGSHSQLRFESDIQPLFRARDRNSMRGHFDLWSPSDVLSHGDAIVRELRAEKMPCDGAWPGESIERLERWLAQGGDA